MTKHDLQSLAETRLGDAQSSLREGRYSAAYYLAGYAVELAIKARIAGEFRADVIPDRSFVNSVYSHRLDDLIALAGLRQKLYEELKRDPHLSASWGIASQWSEASRYQTWDQLAAEGMVQAIGEESHGVLQWLKNHW